MLTYKIFPVVNFNYQDRVAITSDKEFITIDESQVIRSSFSLKERLDYYGSNVKSRLTQSGTLSLKVPSLVQPVGHAKNQRVSMLNNEGVFSHGVEGSRVDVIRDGVIFYRGYAIELKEYHGGRNANSVAIITRPLINRVEDVVLSFEESLNNLSSIIDSFCRLAYGSLYRGRFGITDRQLILEPEVSYSAKDILSGIFGALRISLILGSDGRVEVRQHEVSGTGGHVIDDSNILASAVQVIWNRKLAWNRARVRVLEEGRGADDFSTADVVGEGDILNELGARFWVSYGDREINLDLKFLDRNLAIKLAREFIEARAYPRYRVSLSLPATPAINLLDRVYLNLGTGIAGTLHSSGGIIGQHIVVSRSVNIIKQTQDLELEKLNRGDAAYDNSSTSGAPNSWVKFNGR